VSVPVRLDQTPGAGRQAPGAQRPVARSRPKGGFTLQELLVVATLIAILAAFLMPVLSGAREPARRARCATSLRQLALANMLYAQDHDGYFVPAAPRFYEEDMRRWFGVRNREGRFEPRDGPLVPYLRDGGVLRECPSFAPAVGFDAGTGGYVYNSICVGGRAWWEGFRPEAFDKSAREADLACPAETAMFADGALDVGTGIAEYAFMTPPPAVAARIAGAFPFDPAIHFRHGERANVVFADGHGHALPRALSIPTSPVYPGAAPARHGVGWFGPVEGNTPYDPE
jgi:prepilin-type processing-associated H-X9-DG protein/prepilin-type N-terminal cleavage/methylation domain-containing protein